MSDLESLKASIGKVDSILREDDRCSDEYIAAFMRSVEIGRAAWVDVDGTSFDPVQAARFACWIMENPQKAIAILQGE